MPKRRSTKRKTEEKPSTRDTPVVDPAVIQKELEELDAKYRRVMEFEQAGALFRQIETCEILRPTSRLRLARFLTELLMEEM